MSTAAQLKEMRDLAAAWDKLQAERSELGGALVELLEAMSIEGVAGCDAKDLASIAMRAAQAQRDKGPGVVSEEVAAMRDRLDCLEDYSEAKKELAGSFVCARCELLTGADNGGSEKGFDGLCSGCWRDVEIARLGDYRCPNEGYSRRMKDERDALTVALERERNADSVRIGYIALPTEHHEFGYAPDGNPMVMLGGEVVAKGTVTDEVVREAFRRHREADELPAMAELQSAKAALRMAGMDPDTQAVHECIDTMHSTIDFLIQPVASEVAKHLVMSLVDRK